MSSWGRSSSTFLLKGTSTLTRSLVHMAIVYLSLLSFTLCESMVLNSWCLLAKDQLKIVKRELVLMKKSNEALTRALVELAKERANALAKA